MVITQAYYCHLPPHPFSLYPRSSILTGKYVHNHHTYENSVDKGCDAPSWRELNENKTIGAYMSMAGYRTGFFGESLSRLACLWLGTTLSMSMSVDGAIHRACLWLWMTPQDEAIHRACLWLGTRLSDYPQSMSIWLGTRLSNYPQSMSMAGDEAIHTMAVDEAIHRACLWLGTRLPQSMSMAGDEATTEHIYGWGQGYPQSMSMAGDEATTEHIYGWEQGYPL